MTYARALQVVTDYRQAQHRAVTGRTAYDILAASYGISTGAAVRLVTQARDVEAHGETCSRCHGTGRTKP